jgi:diadenylate cyclase
MEGPLVTVSIRLILDIFDILIVSYLIYRILLLIRGTRATQMILSLAALAILAVAAEWLQLSSLDWLLSSLKTVWVIGFLILFQPELRKALTQFGQNPVFKQLLHVSETASLGEIQKALEAMSKKGLGGIVVIERNVGLRSYVETGTPVEAVVSAELIETIFTPPSPLHDGAVIVRGNQIVAAGCILPLSQSPTIDRTLGTRHRAIVGLSEETDAIAIAVSEETRKISVARRGQITRLAQSSDLRSSLGELLKTEQQADEKPAPAAAT